MVDCTTYPYIYTYKSLEIALFYISGKDCPSLGQHCSFVKLNVLFQFLANSVRSENVTCCWLQVLNGYGNRCNSIFYQTYLLLNFRSFCILRIKKIFLVFQRNFLTKIFSGQCLVEPHTEFP